MSNTTTAPTEWGLPSENLEVVESIDKIKETSQQFLQVGDEYLMAIQNLKKDFFSMFIGSIHQFTGTAGEGFLRCDGSVYKKADYPELYAVIKDSYQSHYQKKNDKDVLPADSFVVPNLTARFLSDGMGTGADDKNLTNGKLGEFHVDMMRQIHGRVDHIGQWGNSSENSSDAYGAFHVAYRSVTVQLHNEGDSSKIDLEINTSKEGAIPSGSPANVGYITRPATVNIYFYILAKI